MTDTPDTQKPIEPAAEMRRLADDAVAKWYRDCRERIAVAAARGQWSGRDTERIPSHLMGPVMARLRKDGFQVYPQNWSDRDGLCNLFVSWEHQNPRTNKLLCILLFLLLVELAVIAAYFG